jgi:hypothetical protein
MDCFAEPVIGPRICADPLARNDGRIQFRIPAARFASGFCIQHRPRKRRGRGEHRVPLHPQSRVQRIAQKKHTSSQQVQPDTLRRSPRDVGRLIPRSPRRTGRSSHRPPGLLSPEGSHQRRGVGTTRLCRTRPRASSCAPTASIATRLTSGNDWPNVPLGEAGWPGIYF